MIPIAAGPGQIGVPTHPQLHVGGLTFNLDTIWSTGVAGLIIIVLGLLIARSATREVPGKLQLGWEGLVSFVEDQVEQTVGRRVAPFVVPLAVTLFGFILVANWLEIIPTNDKLPSPTADANLPYALALLVFVWTNVVGIRRKGIRKYLKGFTRPPIIMTPLNVIEELIKPVTLSLRLFGNLFAGSLMIALIALFPFWLLWAPNVIWKLFDMFIGLIQAFIFALLTIVYFSFQTGEGAH
jgi:F-type H+-transporting ATPase subunit a